MVAIIEGMLQHLCSKGQCRAAAQLHFCISGLGVVEGVKAAEESSDGLLANAQRVRQLPRYRA